MTSVNVSTTKATTAVTETQTGIVVTTDGLFGPRSVSAPLALDANANLGLDFNAQAARVAGAHARVVALNAGGHASDGTWCTT